MNKIKINIKYKMNFSPKVMTSKLLITKSKLNKVYCKNFIFTILIFDLYSCLNGSLKLSNYKFHIIKKRKHIGSILRAPYKNKIAQFSIGIYRYFLILSFFINNDNIININNNKDFINFFKKTLKTYNYFESSLVTQVYRSINTQVLIKIFKY